MLVRQRYTKCFAKTKEHLKQFQNMSATDSNYVAKLKELWGPLKHHIEDEENRDLPALEEALKTEEGASESLATSFERTKLFVPTRSHPSAGEHPPFETAMGLLTAPFDIVSDLFRKFPQQSSSSKI